MNTKKLLRIKDFVRASCSNSWEESKKQVFVKKAYKASCKADLRTCMLCKTKVVRKKALHICKSWSEARRRFAIGLVFAYKAELCKINQPYKALHTHQKMCTHLPKEIGSYKRNSVLTDVFWYPSLTYKAVQGLQLQSFALSEALYAFCDKAVQGSALYDKASDKAKLCKLNCNCITSARHTKLLTNTNPRFVSVARRFVLQSVAYKAQLCTNSFVTTSYTIVRPLMGCFRSTVTLACISAFLPVYPDLSNLKIGYSRNRIRKQIVPTIKFFFNPKAEKAIFQFSEFSNKKGFSIDHLKDI